MTSQPNPLEAVSLADLRLRTSAKWRRYDPDVLPLYVAEMDTPLAPPVREALERAVRMGDTGYPEGHGYAEALAGFADRHWAWQVDPALCVGVVDVITGYVDILSFLTEPGDAVVITPPVYPPFFSGIEGAGRRVIEAPLGADGRLDVEALDRAFGQAAESSTRPAFLLCNPHNPTGVAHTASELEQVRELAERHSVRVVADEIHAPVVYEGATFVPYLEIDPRGYSLMAASKAFNLAGLKSALLIAGTECTAEFSEYRKQLRHGPSHWGVLAQSAAYQDGDEWLASLMAGLHQSRERLTGLISTHLPQAHLLRPEATFLAWIDCRDLGLAGDPAGHFLNHARVALNAGPTFGTGGEGRVRINFACSAEVLEAAVSQMGRSLERVER